MTAPSGEAFFSDTPILRPHAGTQPDLFLRWNSVPPEAAAIDVVVHLHGFSQQRDAMLLAEKVPRCGLDLAGRARPTLAVLPRGNWIRHTWYDFPALLGGGLDALVDYAVERVAAGRTSCTSSTGFTAATPRAASRCKASRRSTPGWPSASRMSRSGRAHCASSISSARPARSRARWAR